MLLRALELYLMGIVLLTAIQAVKLRDFPGRRGPAPGDHAAWLALAGLVAAAAWLSPAAGLALGLLPAGLLLGLWIDALLFRVFTIELGPGGVGGIVAAVLYRELAEMACARRFFRENQLYAALPLAALAMAVRPALELGGVPDVVLAVALVLYAGALFVRTRAPAPAAAPADDSPGILASFLFPRPLPRQPGWVARPEHAALLAAAPRVPERSPLHGSLAGANVLLVTIESLGRDHLDVFAPGGAHAPFLESLLPRAVRSRHHFCVSPTTNNAHIALHQSRYLAGSTPTGVSALADAGLATVYLTPVKTARYGLRELIVGAGFETIIDDGQLVPHGKDAGHLSDYALMEQGPRLLADALAGRRFFAHVHTANSHVPYRVVEPSRFRRHDPDSDRGRFLNAIEEADFIVGELWRNLESAGLAKHTLLVISADHGQSFGELGYQSHGSAITREQLDVPLILHHPALGPRELAWSSHFDVLPTVCDLLGVAPPAGFGASIFSERPAELLVWAGRPSRTSTSNFGLVLPDQKIMLDLVAGRCLTMDWDDGAPRELADEQRRYFAALAAEVFTARGLR